MSSKLNPALARSRIVQSLLLKLALVPFLACLGVLAQAQGDPDPRTPVLVEIAGLVDAQGKVYIAVYDNEDDWLSDDVFMAHEVDIESSRDGEMVSTELLLPPGQYAFSVFYDENGNGKMDTNFIGIPKEPIAMSNNAKGKFGPPKYEDALFELDLEPVNQRINIVAL